MACNCRACPNFLTATAVATAAGVTTITVPATFQPSARNDYCILLRVSIPKDSSCNSVSITNGTATWSVLECDGDNWRPCSLKCRSVLKLRFFDDPAHFLIKRTGR